MDTITPPVDLNDAAKRAATTSGRVYVRADHESKHTWRVLFWERGKLIAEDKPYVLVGRRNSRHREYLIRFEWTQWQTCKFVASKTPPTGEAKR